MDLKYLKICIENNKPITFPLVFIDKNQNNILIPQYIEAISKNLNLDLRYMNYSDLLSEYNSILGIDQGFLNIIREDELCASYEDIENMSNTIFICIKADNIKDVISIPEIKEWQLKDYIYSTLPYLENKNKDKLFYLLKDNSFRLLQETDKLKLFQNTYQNSLFNQMIEDNQFSDISSYTIYSFTDALIIRDLNKLKDILMEIKNIDINPVGLVTVLYNNIKNIINIQLGKNPTAESLGLKPKQFIALKYRINKYSNSALLNIFKLLTEVDFKLKTGKLPVDLIIDYLYLHILNY